MLNNMDELKRENLCLHEKVIKLLKENGKLRHGIIRGKELYHKNEVEQMFLVWKHALGEK